MSISAVVPWTVVIRGKVEAAHGCPAAVAEASAVLWWLQDVCVTWRGRRCGKAGEGIEKGRYAGVILSCAAAWLYRPDAYNNYRHHSAFTFFFAFRCTICRTAAMAPVVVTSCAISSRAKAKHAEEVERRLSCARSVTSCTIFIAPQCRCYAAVLKRL